MRKGWMLSGWAVLLLSPWSARAEPMVSRIVVSEVTVRSGPSPEFYPTSRLHRGEAIRVVREEAGGWLAVVPPSGSFSWIHTSLVEQIGSSAAVVSAPEAQIWVGSRLINAKPTVWRTKVRKGTQLTVIGRAEVAQDGTWLPILPAPAEVRYIPAEAVAPRGPSLQSVAAPPEPAPPAATPAGFAYPRPTGPGSSSAPPPSNAGSVAQPVASSAVASRPLQAEPNSGTAGGRSFLAPSGSAVPPGAAFPPSPQPPASSEYCYQRDSGYAARLSAPVVSAPNPPSPSEQWYEPGHLRRTAFSLDNRPLYCLQPVNAKTRHIYVAAGPNVNLEPYVEKEVYLCGPMVYRGDLRTYYMTVVRVSPAH